MPSKQTQNYKLSQWEADDKVLRTDFNADNLAIDAALKSLDTSLSGKASASSLNSLQTTVDGKASQTDLNALSATVEQLQSALSVLEAAVEKKQDSSGAVRFTTGTYDGSGSASRTISVGFKPKAVALYTCEGVQIIISGGRIVYGGLATPDLPVRIVEGGKSYNAVEITSSGFKVYQTEDLPNYCRIYCNKSGASYHYIAFE